MFENIKEEQSNFSWYKLKKYDNEGWEEHLNTLSELKEVIEELKTGITDESTYNLEEKRKNLLDYIKTERASEIVYLAYKNWIEGSFDGIVFIDLDTGKLSGESWTSSTVQNPESELVEVYRLHNNWVNNNPFQVNDILTDEEWEQLQDNYSDNANFLNREQLENIGVDFDTRLMDYLRWVIEN